MGKSSLNVRGSSRHEGALPDQRHAAAAHPPRGLHLRCVHHLRAPAQRAGPGAGVSCPIKTPWSPGAALKARARSLPRQDVLWDVPGSLWKLWTSGKSMGTALRAYCVPGLYVTQVIHSTNTEGLQRWLSKKGRKLRVKEGAWPSDQFPWQPAEHSAARCQARKWSQLCTSFSLLLGELWSGSCTTTRWVTALLRPQIWSGEGYDSQNQGPRCGSHSIHPKCQQWLFSDCGYVEDPSLRQRAWRWLSETPSLPGLPRAPQCQPQLFHESVLGPPSPKENLQWRSMCNLGRLRWERWWDDMVGML